jgi:hypothetical protein
MGTRHPAPGTRHSDGGGAVDLELRRFGGE